MTAPLTKAYTAFDDILSQLDEFDKEHEDAIKRARIADKFDEAYQAIEDILELLDTQAREDGESEEEL